jgi:hypothetical protein
VDVDITTSACGGSLPLMARTTPDPVGTDPIPWTAQEFTVVGQQPIAQQSRIDATLANVASLEIDTSDYTGACVAGDQIDYEITTDGPTQVSFSDGSTLDFAAAGTYTGTLPEPGPAASLAAGAVLIAAIGRRRRRHSRSP